tara:strand:- start:25 stop:618 length:594 start_codon:yes stop_codon:yes gene_type:complete
MIISAVKVLELNDKYELISNLCERELNNPEGVAIDLRVGKVHKIISDSLLASDESGRERYSPKTELVGDVNIGGDKMFTIKPGEYFLVTTMEVLHSPAKKIKYDEELSEGYLVPKVMPRSSLQRGGVSLHYTGTNPGYKGELTFGIKNLGNQDFHFELGSRMFSVEFHTVIGDINRAYSGQHQGGRVTSGGEVEVQN